MPRTVYRPRVDQRGENASNAKLADRDIPRIRELIAEGYCARCVARMYEVSYWTIRDIIQGNTWRHIP